MVVQLDDDRSSLWPGVISFSEEKTTGILRKPVYDGLVAGNIFSAPTYSGKIECYTYPSFLDEGDSFIGDLSFRTEVEGGYYLYLLYDCSIFFESHSGYETMINVAPSTFKWGVLGLINPDGTTRDPIRVRIDSRLADSEAMSIVEEILKGSEDSPPRIPSIKEIEQILQINATLIVTDNGDGTYKAEGPDSVVYKTSETEFAISWPSVVIFHGTEGTFQVSSQ